MTRASIKDRKRRGMLGELVPPNGPETPFARRGVSVGVTAPKAELHVRWEAR
jgi:hypothetical protein